MPIHIEDYTFDGPFARVEDLKERAGVYAVVCLMSNQKHFLIDVGESDNIRNAIETRERKDCWITNCKGNLLVAALYTTELDTRGRADIVAFIRSREFVPCENKQ